MTKKPIILAVDDDEDVLDALSRDLKAHFSSSYRIVTAHSGDEALELVKRIKQKREEVALFLSDQRMPGMSGVDFLAQARQIYPEAKFFLLTAYADTDAAVKAINEVKIDYYLTKPWDPPEERLLPILDDHLADWNAHYHPDFDGIKVIGDKWSSETHKVKEFLSRNLVPYFWIDIEKSNEADLYLDENEPRKNALPLLVMPDGKVLKNPEISEIAESIGLKTQAEDPFYDLVIIGGGPAGLAAAVYASSEGVKTVLIEAEAPGGQAGTSTFIENYLGFPSGLTGSDLTRRAVTQARKFGTEIISPKQVKEISLINEYKKITLDDDSVIRAYSVIVATGARYRKLDTEGIGAFAGRGVYYGTSVTEAELCKEEDIFIVGGGNSAGQAALYLSKFARTVTILIRKEGLEETMSQYLIHQINNNPCIKLKNLCEITRVEGKEKLEYIEVADCNTGEKDRLRAHALFIYIGANPCAEWLNGLMFLDDEGFIKTGRDLKKKDLDRRYYDRPPYFLETSVPGVFAAGDVRSGSIKRVASAVGEGAMAVSFIHKYLSKFR